MSSTNKAKVECAIGIPSLFMKYIWAGWPPVDEGVIELKKNPTNE